MQRQTLPFASSVLPVALAAVAGLSPVPALAAGDVAPGGALDGAIDGAIDASPLVAPLVAYAVELAMAALLTLAAWLARRVAGWLRLKEDGEVRSYLDSALIHALEWARERALAEGRNLSDIKVRAELVELAADYVLPKVPDALRRFGVTPGALTDMLTARLGEVAPQPRRKAGSSQAGGD